MTILEIRSIGVSAGGKPLLHDVNLSLGTGEIVALTGPSGSGKTSLLRVICGLDDTSAGTVLLRDRPPQDWPTFRRDVLLVAQKPAVFDLTVEESLRRPFAYRANRSQVPFPEKQARLLLVRLGLGESGIWTQNANTLSVGQQQRLCLIRALLLEPVVLLLDEPTSALDAESVSSVEGLLRQEVRRREMAALVVTHNMRQAETWCDRIFDLTPFRVDKGGD